MALVLGVALAMLAASPAAAAGRPGSGQANFEGAIESLPAAPSWVGDWKVAGVAVHVMAATEVIQLRARVAVGARVAVQAQAQGDGSVVAARIEVRPAAPEVARRRVEFFGTIAALPATTADWVGDWTVGMITVHVGAAAASARRPARSRSAPWSTSTVELAADGAGHATSIEVMAPPPGAPGRPWRCAGRSRACPPRDRSATG